MGHITDRVNLYDISDMEGAEQIMAVIEHSLREDPVPKDMEVRIQPYYAVEVLVNDEWVVAQNVHGTALMTQDNAICGYMSKRLRELIQSQPTPETT